MNTIKNVIAYWLNTGKNCKSGEDVAVWCLLSSIIVGVCVGFGFLAWFFPIISAFIFTIVFLPILIILYVKFNDLKINERIKELKKLEEKYKAYERYY